MDARADREHSAVAERSQLEGVKMGEQGSHLQLCRTPAKAAW